jgi:PAS domain S-box-containing protein
LETIDVVPTGAPNSGSGAAALEDLKALFAHSPDGILILDPEGCVAAANPAAEALLGRPLGGLSLEQLDLAGCLPGCARRLSLARPEGGAVEVEARCLALGPERQALLLRHLGPLAGGDEAAVRDAERLRLMARATREAFFDWDIGAEEVWLNEGAYRMVGEEPAPFTSADWWLERLHPEDREAVEAGLLQALGGAGDQWVGTYRLRRRDGTWVHCVTRACIVRDAAGTARRLIGSTADISELVAREERLRSATAALEALVEACPLALIGLNDEGRIIHFWNPAAERIFGWSRSEVMGRLPPFIPEEKLEEFFKLLCRLLGGQVVLGVERQRRRRDGSPVEVRIWAAPLRDAQGRVGGTVAVVEDVTEQKKMQLERQRLQEQLLEAQKMESVGRLAGGIAHDFNNLLSVILGFAELALLECAPESPLCGYLKNITTAGERARDLTRQLLAFARRQVIEPVVLDANDLLTDVTSLLRRIIGEHIELVTRTTPDLWACRVDVGQMEQVLMNLAVNARDAMPSGGQLCLETANAVLEESCGPLPPGEYVRLTVRDTGTGMEEEVQAHVFEPFFTTKPKGQGTGLGLATCYGIVRQHGGHICFSSQPGRGTAFHVYLPRVLGVAPVRTPGQAPAAPGGSETILLVEDEPLVLEVAVAALRGLGYKVLCAGSGDEALALARQHPEPIHLLLTDVVMPNMSGPDLARRLAEMRPGTRVLYTSGYTDDTVLLHGVLEAGVAFLQKPYGPAALAARVREVLDRPEDTPYV